MVKFNTGDVVIDKRFKDKAVVIDVSESYILVKWYDSNVRESWIAKSYMILDIQSDRDNKLKQLGI